MRSAAVTSLANSRGTELRCCGTVNTTACGHPDDEWGWAVGAGMTLKMPWDPKDTFSVEAGLH